MATVTFSGTVSGQAQANETVTITVTKPDGITETLTAPTNANLSFSTSEVYTVAGAYLAKASIAADAAYQAATSPSAPFTIALATRSITLNVVVS